MIDSVFAFNDRTAREIRVPRRDVVSFDINEPFDTLLDDILETRHNRIPVYDDDIDNIIGVLHIKDVMIELRKDIRPEDLDIRAMLHEPFFVPETKTTDSLFRDMQANRRHMAILVDEHGGFSGIVTIEDLVEAIMGNIDEEYDDVAPEIEAIGPDEYLLDGGLLIDDLNEELELSIESEDCDTISGYLIEQLGHIPQEGARERITIDNLAFLTEDVRDNRIASVRMKILPQISNDE